MYFCNLQFECGLMANGLKYKRLDLMHVFFGTFSKSEKQKECFLLSFVKVLMFFLAFFSPYHTIAQVEFDTIGQPMSIGLSDSVFVEMEETGVVVPPDSVSLLMQRVDDLTRQLDSNQLRLATMHSRMRDLIMLKDSLIAMNDLYQKELDEKSRLMQEQKNAMIEKERLVAEKEELYRQALTNSTIDRVKWEAELKNKETSIEAKSHEIAYLQKDIDSKEQTLQSQRENYQHVLTEKEYYRHLVDSLQKKVNAIELENIRKIEENKYLAQRAKDAEEKASVTINKKKKVRPIQGIAMRFFRTPDWDMRLDPVPLPEGGVTYNKVILNRHEGKIEFDFVTGASVMLWDMTDFFNKSRTVSDSVNRIPEIPHFDQKFNYDVGIYVGFGGTNLFKNFYVGPSFRFVDFFYLTVGVNVCEYELLVDNYKAGDAVDPALTLPNITAKSWLVKPFVALSIDLDFLSYIKK